MDNLDNLIAHYAQLHGVPLNYARALVQLESSRNPQAVSRTGAQGLTQLMPGTARALGVQNAFDPAQNLNGGLHYYAQQLKRFGDPATAYAAYNAGPGAIEKYGGIPPYKETQMAVSRFKQLAGMPNAGQKGARSPVQPLPKRSAGTPPTQYVNAPNFSALLAKNPVEDYLAQHPQPERFTISPEILQRQQGLAEQAVGPNQFQAQLPAVQGQQAGFNAERALLDSVLPRPNAQDYSWDTFTPPALPERQQLAIPERVKPQTDVTAGIMGALAGFLDPVGAGSYNAAPIQAGIGTANQLSEDNLRRWGLAQGQQDQAYQDALLGRNDQVANAKYNRAGESQAQQDLADAQYRYAGALSPVVGGQAQSGTLAPALSTLATQQSAADKAKADLGSLQYGLGAQMDQSQNAISDWDKQQKLAIEGQNHWLQRLLTGAQLDATAQYRQGQLSQQKASLEERVAHNQTMEEIARIRVNKVGQLVGPSGKVMTPYQKVALQLRAAGMGITLPPQMIGGLNNVIPGLGDIATEIRNRRATELQLRDPRIRAAQSDKTAAVTERDRLFHAYQNAFSQGIETPEALNSRKLAVDRADNVLRQKDQALSDLISTFGTKAPATPSATTPAPPPAKKVKTATTPKKLYFDPATGALHP